MPTGAAGRPLNARHALQLPKGQIDLRIAFDLAGARQVQRGLELGHLDARAFPAQQALFDLLQLRLDRADLALNGGTRFLGHQGAHVGLGNPVQQLQRLRAVDELGRLRLDLDIL